MKDSYMGCYMSGRFDHYDGEINHDDIVDRVTSGSSTVRDLCLGAAKTAINGEMDTATKVQWLKDNVDEIKEMGGDTEKAYLLYMQGRIDGLAHHLEAEVVTMLEQDMDDGGDDGEDDEDDDSDDDESEEDEEE